MELFQNRESLGNAGGEVTPAEPVSVTSDAALAIYSKVARTYGILDKRLADAFAAFGFSESEDIERAKSELVRAGMFPAKRDKLTPVKARSFFARKSAWKEVEDSGEKWLIHFSKDGKELGRVRFSIARFYALAEQRTYNRRTAGESEKMKKADVYKRLELIDSFLAKIELPEEAQDELEEVGNALAELLTEFEPRR